MHYKFLFFILLLYPLILHARIDDRVDLNLAQTEQLLSLYGMSEEDADNIIKYRMQKGEFQRIEELIPLIGPDKYELLRYDVKVTPLESRFRDALSGYFFLEQYNLEDGTANAQNFGKTKISVYDAVDVYMQKQKKYNNNNDLFYKKKWEYIRNVTFNIYRRSSVVDDKKPAVEPELELFKRVDLKQERDQKASEAFDFLDEYFNGKPKTSKKKEGVTAGEYMVSDYDVNRYLQTEDAKRELYEENKAKVRFIRRDEDSPTMPPKELPAEEEEKMVEIPDGPRYKKELVEKAVLGNFYLPSVRSPLVARSSSEHIRGLRFYHFADEWDSSFFYGNMPLREGKVFGMDFNFNLGKDSKFSLVGYNFKEEIYNNSFPCLSLNGSKQITKDTSIFFEYDHVSNRVYSLYGKLYTKLNNYALTTTLTSVTPTYRDISQLYPYFGSSNTFQGYLDAGFKVAYSFLKSSVFSIDITNTKMKDNYYSQSEKTIQDYSANLQYEPLSRWSFNIVSGYKNNNYDESKYTSRFQFYTTYKADSTSTIKMSIKNTEFINRKSGFHTLEYIKKIKKLSLAPKIVFYRNDKDDGTGNQGVLQADYYFNSDTSFSSSYDVDYAQNKDGNYEDTRVWHFSLNTKF